MFKKLIGGTVLAASLACAGLGSGHAEQAVDVAQVEPALHADWAGGSGRAVKVMIVSMFGPEGQVWLDQLGPWQAIRVPGLSPDYPSVHCNRSDVCVLTTGMGHANAAASTMALVLSRQFDLRRTYFLVAGIAGIDPAQGTIGSAAWAHYLVDFGLQWELDAREIPAGWQSGYLGANTKGPAEKPPLDYRTEVFKLNDALVQRAFALSRGVQLSDSAPAQVARVRFGYAPANLPPSVIQCDTLASDTWWSGTQLGQRARDWTKLLTHGKGVYCTTQQEDNATYEALKRGAAEHRVDLSRVAVLRAGSDFDRPAAGQSSADNLLNYAAQGGFQIALQNLYLAGNPLVQEIVTHWKAWRDGVPKH
ncbi:purine nucleoside permease (plasmid) [Mycetohabitans rhizoxinica]|nr:MULTISPECIES: purine nucleoside permease [Mycetohabitans]MCG1048555.1 purine nucleoside permease [Mycetohabitans sp. B6]